MRGLCVLKHYKLDITGSGRTVQYLISALEGGYLSHAYIFEGADGSGRHTLVKELLKAMACEDDDAPCGVCGPCMKIDAGVCVDVRYISPAEGKTELTVDLIRSIYDTVGMSPSELDFKAYVIENGEKMNPSAQNAFLKLLEEPPGDVRFFIITNDASKLLPTVRSRALILRLDKLGKKQMEQVLDRHNIGDSMKRREAIALADGSAGEAMRIIRDEDSVVKYRSVSDSLADILFLPGGGKLALISCLQKNCKKAEDLYRVAALLQRALRDIAVTRLGTGAGMIYFGTADDAEKYAMNISDKACIACQDVTSELLALSDVPLNPQLAVTEFCSRLWDARLL